MPYLEGKYWYTNLFECWRSSLVIPPSPVVVEVPAKEAPLPKASFAVADKAPKLIPAIVTGISISNGFSAFLVPNFTAVSQFSLYPSSGYLDIEAPKKRRSSK